MAAPLIKHLVVIQYKLGTFPSKSPVFPNEKGLIQSVEHLHGDVANSANYELPIKGCIDYEVVNKGTSIAYLFDGAIEILPGQNYSPAKSSNLPLINNPKVTFEGDFQMTRAIADLVVPPTVS